MPNNISQKGETQTASFVVAKHIKAKHSFCPFHLFFFLNLLWQKAITTTNPSGIAVKVERS